MDTYRKVLSLRTEAEGCIVDITKDVDSAVSASKMDEGLACVFVPHSTAAVFAIEHEPGVEKDLRAALQRSFPKEIRYEHDQAWHDGNGHSHVRSSFLGPSLTVPFHAGALDLGTWQQLVLMELDNRGRERKVIIQIIGQKVKG